MSANSKQEKHLYSHDVRLRRVGLLGRPEVVCMTPECGRARVFFALNMTQAEWGERLNAFYKKHRTFKVKHDGPAR